MKYHLICIWTFDKDTHKLSSVTIEVCLNVGKKIVSPFQRKVTVYDLMHDFGDENEDVLNALAATGQINQPFTFINIQLCNKTLRDALDNIPAQYVRQGASIKPFNRHIDYLFIKPDYSRLNQAHLISAELTIVDVAHWWNNMQIRFRYEDILNPISATNRFDIPMIKDNGIPVVRNIELEEKYIANLFGKLDFQYSTLSLNKADTTALRQCIDAGWKVFVKKGRKTNHRLKAVPNQYGIDWFTTSTEDKSLSEDLSERLLAAYLHNQNYYESSDGNINITNSSQIQDIPSFSLANIINPTINFADIYSPIKRLNDMERNDLCQFIYEHVNATLLDFQLEGVIWLTEMRNHNTGCLLADDMGLGKTLQTLAYLSTRPKSCKFLVVSPTSLVENWANEMMRFVPQIHAQTTIISFDKLRLNCTDVSSINYDTLIIDEGQLVKNSNTQRHQIFSKIQRSHTIMLSGTPIENGIHEIWSQFNILIPGIITIQKRLQQMWFASEDDAYVEITRKLLTSFILRRVKEDVLEEFPHKHINNIFINLSNNERDTYTRIKQIIIKALRDGVTGRVNSLALTALLRLRQACVCTQILPQQLQYHDIRVSSKFSKALEIIKSNLASGNKILVFSQFTSVLEKFRDLLVCDDISNYILTGNTSNRIKLVELFNNTEDAGVFLISLKAGGMGLNLTAANRVILLDDWWNPAVEDQAFARSYRIGQTQDVEIYRLICKNTVEEKILELQAKKLHVSGLFNSTTEKITLEDIRALIE